MIAILLAVVSCVQTPKSSAAAGRDAHVAHIGRTAVLQFDPAQLPRAEPRAWNDMGGDIAFAPDREGELLGPIHEAQAAALRGDFIGALDPLLGQLIAQPDFPPALHLAAVLYFRLQRYGDSSVLMQRYIEVAPKRIGDTRVLGHDLYSLGRYAEARAHYEKVVVAAPMDVEARRGLALTLWRLGDPAQALKLLDGVIAQAPKHDEAWSWKAQILFDTGDNETALAAAEQARALDPFEPRTWYLLGRILEELGRTDAARDARQRFGEVTALAQEARRRERAFLSQPDRIDDLVALLDLYVRSGDRPRIQGALDRLRLARGADTCPARRARLDALVALAVWKDAAVTQEGKSCAAELERCAPDEERAWASLERYYAAIGDAVGAARATDRRKAIQQH